MATARLPERPTRALRRVTLAALVAATTAGALPASPPGPESEADPDAGWAVGIGGRNREYLTDLAVGGDGGSYLSGHFLGRFEAGEAGGIDAVGDADGFLLRLDPAGRALWAHGFGAAGADEARAVAVGPGGEVYLAGFFSETVDFDPGPGRLELTSAGSSDVFLARFEADGAALWARSFGGPYGDLGLDIAVDSSGAVHLAGYFQGEVDFDPGPGERRLSSAGGTDAFLARFGPEGELRAVVSLGGPASDEARAVAVDAAGGAAVCGLFRQRASSSAGGEALVSAGSSDAFVARLDPAGDLVWLRRWGGESSDSCNAIALDTGGDLVATGRFAGEAGGAGATLASAGSTDAWLLRLGADGAARWARRLGEAGSDFGFGVAAGAGRVWVTGFLQPVPDAAGAAETRSFLAAYDDAGEPRAYHSMTATTGIQALTVALDPASRPVIAGVFDGDATLDPGTGEIELSGAGKVDIFVARYPAGE